MPDKGNSPSDQKKKVNTLLLHGSSVIATEAQAYASRKVTDPLRRLLEQLLKPAAEERITAQDLVKDLWLISTLQIGESKEAYRDIQ